MSVPGRLRIAVVLKTAVGGLWILPQIAEFQNRGHQVVVILPAGPGRLRTALADQGIDVVESPFDFVFRRRPATVRALWRFRRLLKEIRPDVVHYHLYASAVASRLAMIGDRALRAHMVAGPLFLEAPLVRWAERHLWRLDDLTICGADFTSRLYGDLGCPPERRPVVTYGVDTFRFSRTTVLGDETHAAFRRKVRAGLGIDEDAFLVIMVAYVFPPRGLVHRGRGIKGHDVLLRAWTEFHATNPRSHLLLVGGGWNPAGEEYRHGLIRAFDVTNRPDVTWMETTDEVRAFYVAADLSVSPSLSEGHGAAVEASAMGVPSVVSNAGGLPETVDESTGWVVPRDDPARLAAGLDIACREFTAGRLGIRGENARRRCVRLFDDAAAARLLAGLIEDASARHGAPAGTAADAPVRSGALVPNLRIAGRVINFLWSHPANQGARLQALARAAAFQVRGRLGLSTMARIGDNAWMVASLHQAAASKVVYANPPDWPEMQAWRRLLGRRDLFIDVGSNVGAYALWAADAGASVIAIEPDPAAAESLRRNVALNDLPVDVLECALAAAPGQMRLTSGNDTTNHLLLDREAGGTLVRVRTLDDVIGTRQVAGIKIDVEGAERLVLAGAPRALAEGRIAVLQLEWNSLSEPVLGETRAPLVTMLRHHGYVFARPDDAGRLVPADPTDYGKDLFALSSDRRDLR